MEEKPSKQTIEFSGKDPDPTFAVHSRDVEVISAGGMMTNGVSRIKASNMVDYSWEERFYTGQMLAVHKSGNYIAYGIKGKSKTQCTIRIVNRDSSNRALMKDTEGMIEDLSFAQSPDIILLACVDNTGTLLVYHITEIITEISTTLILHVLPDETFTKPIPYRVFWSSSIPEEDFEDDDVSKLLAITRNNKIELWSISTISPNLEPIKEPIKSGDVKVGYLVIEAHDDLITEAVFSPDGTAIATASLDGTCKFYQVYMPPGEAESRCLHQWSPHHGRPVTMLLFLDDFTKFNPDVPFWKYAVTATDNNNELSLWSCETWQRLQHIKFKHIGSTKRKFKIGLDISASIMVINDMPNRILYILELNKGEIQSTIPYVATVTELRLHYAILSFGIVEASIGPYQPNMSPALDESTARINGENEKELGVMIRMFIVQPKSLQSCDIAYPTKRSNIPIPSPLPNVDYENGDCVYDNGVNNDEEGSKPDIPSDSGDMVPLEEEEDQEIVACMSLTPPQPSLNLMTPDAFSSTAEPEENELATVTHETPTEEVVEIPPVISPVQPNIQPDNNPPQPKSGGSSPSREVEEILALKNLNFYEQEMVISIQPVSVQPPQPVQVPQSYTPPQVHIRTVTSEDKSCGPSVSMPEDEDLKNDVRKLCQIIERQNLEIQDLKNHVKMMESKVNNFDTLTNLLERFHSVTSSQISSHQEMTERQIVSHQEKAEKFQSQLLEKMNVHQEKAEKLHSDIIEKMNSHQEETVSHICQLVGNSISTRLPPMIHSQLLNMVNPAIKDLKDQMHKELTVKLTATDVLLKENISKLVKNKALIDTLANGVAAVGKESVAQVCKESLNLALPRIEKVCSTMMSDMAETFTNGTSQYVSEVESQLKRLTEHWHVEVNNLHTSFLEQANAQTLKMIEKSLSDMEDRLFKKLSMTVIKAVNSGVTSRVMTPAFGSSAQADIMKLIEQGQLSDAFQQALSASELSLVMYVCEKVPVDHIFTEKGSVLAQPVLLSLIQQLSSNMSAYTKTTHKYLAEAVMNLNPRSSVTREHMPKILSSLNKQLQHYIANNPTSSLTKDVRMLQMATQSLLNC